MCTRINKNQTWPKTLIVEVEQKTRRPLSSAANEDSDNLCIGSFRHNHIGICSCFGGTGSENAFLCSSNQQPKGKLCISSIWGEPSVGIVFKWSLVTNFSIVHPLVRKWSLSCYHEKMKSLGGHKVLPELSQSSPKIILKLCQRCVKVVSKLFQSCVKVVSKLCQRCVKVVSKVWHSNLRVVSKIC